MLQELILFPATCDVEEVDRFLEKYVVPAHRASPGFRSMTMNAAPLMSPFGAPAYCRVVAVTLGSLDDMMAIGNSPIIQGSKDETPEGMQVLFYEYEE